MATPFSPDSSIVILNAPTLDDQGNLDTFLAKRTGTLPSGAQRKPRYTVEVRSQPLLLNFDDEMIAGSYAQDYQRVIQDQIRLIAETAKPATLAKRAAAAGQLAAGLPGATKRYSGGRMGAMPPNQSDKLFNDSGRLREGIHVRQNSTDKTFTINLPANRDLGQSPTMFQRLLDLVAALDPRKAVQLPAMEAAWKRIQGDMVAKAENASAAKALRLEMMKRRVALAALRAAASLL